MIHIPLEIGDIILTGKFKNKKVTVKEFGIDDHGLPTVNGKGILKIRIPKLMKKQEGDMKVPKLMDLMNEQVYRELDKAKKVAEKESKNGYVVHVNKIDSGKNKNAYELSDWYDSDLTVASYENGRKL